MRFQIKGFVSLFLAMAFSVLALSGVILYFAPRCRVAEWTQWTVLGLSKADWHAVHLALAVATMIAGGLHWYLNWSMFWGYIKKSGVLALSLKREMFWAVVLAAFFIGGAAWRMPPFDSLERWNDEIKEFWDRRAEGSAPPATHDQGQGKGRGMGQGRGRGMGQRADE